MCTTKALSAMHNIVTFVWNGERDYTLEHAALLKKGLDKYMSEPFTLTVICDDYEAMETNGFIVMPLPESAKRLANVRTPENPRFPSSYRRLWLFSEEAKILGPRVMLVDVDVLVTGDWAPLFEEDCDFIGWQPFMLWGVEKRLAGGQWILKTGTHTEVWDDFIANPDKQKKEANARGFRGSDQAWISYKIRDKASIWPDSMGVYSVRDFTRDRPSEKVHSIPADACVVHFNGKNKPWHEVTLNQHPWIRNYI